MRSASLASLLRPLALVAALGAAGCASRLNGLGGVDDLDGAVASAPDLARGPDLAAPPDLAPPVDLRPPGKTCGQIIQCTIGCGLMLGACQLQCFQGGSSKGTQEAGALLACAAQSCILGAGDGGTQNILFCIISKCSAQVQACEGFGFGM